VPLLFAALVLTAAGFVVFWLVRADALALVGLAVTGVGIAVLFPLALALTVAAAGGATDAATARGQLLAGVAALLAPFALGAAADLFGLRAAFAVEPALLCVAAALVGAARPARQ
jgi:fucose permease